MLVGLVLAYGAHALGPIPTSLAGTPNGSPHAADGTGHDGGDNGTGNGTAGDHETENGTGEGSDQPPGETENDTGNGSSDGVSDPGNDSSAPSGNESENGTADGDLNGDDSGAGNASENESGCPGPIGNRSAEPYGGNGSLNGSDNESSDPSWNDGWEDGGEEPCPYVTQGVHPNESGENSSTTMPENSTGDPSGDPPERADPPTSAVPRAGLALPSLATGRLTVPIAVVGTVIGGLGAAVAARHGLRRRR